MGDTPFKIKQLVKTSHFAFFTIVIILAILLFNNNIVNAQTVSGSTNGFNWSYDDSSMESFVTKYDMLMPDNTYFMNYEDSGFPYKQPFINRYGWNAEYTKFNGCFVEKSFLSNFVSSSTYNSGTYFSIPDSFTIDGVNVNTDSFSSCNFFGVFADYHPSYVIVLSNDSSAYSYFNYGAGYQYYQCNDVNNVSDIYILFFSEGGFLTGISKPYTINGQNNCLFLGYSALCGNSPIYSHYDKLVPWENTEDRFVVEASAVNEVEDINYISLSSSDSDYEDGSGGTPENNLYMRSADWVFNIPKYKKQWYKNNWMQGDIRFQGLLNDYQKANSDKFRMKYEFYIHFLLYQDNFDWGTGVEDLDIDRIYSYSVYEDLSDFISNGNVSNFKVVEIMRNAGLYDTIADIYNSFDGGGPDTGEIDNMVWNIECKAAIQTNNPNDNPNSSSGAIVENYNFLNQISNETENNITKNYNPQKDDDGNIKYDPSHDDDSSDDDSTVTKKDGNIILTNNDNDNNNQTVNIDNGHDEIINTLYDKLVPADSNSNGGLTQRFLDITQSNRWFNLMATAMPYIPMDFWNTMYHLLVVCLGITGIAFFIWIVCHII